MFLHNVLAPTRMAAALHSCTELQAVCLIVHFAPEDGQKYEPTLIQGQLLIVEPDDRSPYEEAETCRENGF